MEFDWDADNLEHIARHGIGPGEAEEAILIEPLEADVQQRKGEERVLCFGRTKVGRLVTILYIERRGKIRVVTAYDMTKAQQQLYFQGK
ncbi:MAG TPA: BrnT family toxin [Bryobacteraceae bacterium]|nr:BrnT family toxin [Bryobacteraceae bacterium]